MRRRPARRTAHGDAPRVRLRRLARRLPLIPELRVRQGNERNLRVGDPAGELRRLAAVVRESHIRLGVQRLPVQVAERDWTRVTPLRALQPGVVHAPRQPCFPATDQKTSYSSRVSPAATFPEFFEGVAEQTGEPRQGLRETTRTDPISAFPDDVVRAPWLAPTPDPETDAIITEVAVVRMGEVASRTPFPIPQEIRAGRFTAAASPSVDALAVYRPWHFFYEDWGIYVFERPFFGLVLDTADLAGITPTTLASLVFRQVLSHEWSHFAFEITATEIESVTGVPCYRDYSFWRYSSATRWGGPLEEAVAVWREVAFSRGALPKSMRPKPRGYVHAVRILADASPPGYCDWACMKRPGRGRTEVISYLASLIAGANIGSGRWGETQVNERDQVPVYWVGDPTRVSPLGGIPKSIGPPTIRRFEKWLRKKEAIISETARGSHRKLRTSDGQEESYATGAGFLLRPEAEKISRLFGLRNSSALYEEVARKL